ncbi:MAG: hypothetical protein JNG88_18050 [Phycisphaerales bacterium]|nr:hypothetical protein [Phycisphaerales bacterium]
MYIELGTLGGPSAGPWGINSTGKIVGDSLLDWAYSSDDHGFLWTGSEMIDLPPLGGDRVPYSVAFGLNDHDVAVGTSQLAISAQYRATVWDHGSIIDLGTLPSRLFSRAEAINNAGQIVGYCSFDHAGDSDQEAVLWQDGQIIELGPLEPPDPQSGHRWMTLPYDINDYGEIVCIGQTGWDSTECYIWHDGVITRFREFLPEGFDWTLGPAAINNAGQIACTGRHPDVQYPRAIILTPPVCRGFPRGDANCDGLVNNFDIDAFVLALSNVDQYAATYAACNWLCNLDINRDGAVNNFDIDPFVMLLAE